MTTVYSFVINKMSNNDEELFLIDKLGSNQFKLEVIDLSPLLFNTRLNKNYKSISSIKELEKFISSNKIFILNFGINIKYSRVLNILKKFNNKKLFISINNGKLTVPKYYKFSCLNSSIFKMSKIINFLYSKSFLKFNINYFEAGLPNHNNSIMIPSFEYDKYLDNKDNNSNSYHLFLDQNIVHHRDLTISNRVNVHDGKLYHQKVSQFFDRLEASTGKPVKIALHPRTEHSLYNFGNREVFLNKTFELMRNADIVIGHFSTSIHYSIIYNKKLLLVAEEQMYHCGTLPKIEAFSEELKIPIINIDNFSDFSNIEKYTNRSEYKKYMNKYIISNQIDPNIPSYKIINREIDRLIEEKDL